MNREQIEQLKVGDFIQSTIDVDPFTGKLKEFARWSLPKKIVKIVSKKNDVNGKIFAIGHTEGYASFGPNSEISFSIKEGSNWFRLAK